MKLSVKFILLTMMIAITSLASGRENHGDSLVSVARPQTATPNVPARVKHKRIVKSKVQRPVPFGIDDIEYEVLVDDLATGYRRRDLNKLEHEDGISERIRWKLFLARQLAMFKYKAVHG
jgi:hypothetical protein